MTPNAFELVSCPGETHRVPGKKGTPPWKNVLLELAFQWTSGDENPSTDQDQMGMEGSSLLRAAAMGVKAPARTGVWP